MPTDPANPKTRKQRDIVLKSLAAADLLGEIMNLAAERIADKALDAIPQERVEQIVAKRIGQLTLEEATKYLQLKNVRALRRVCAHHRIPIVKLGERIEHIRIADIEAAQDRHALLTPGIRRKSLTSPPSSRQPA